MIALCLFSFLLVGTLGYPAPADDSLLDSSNDVIPQGDAASLIPEGEVEGELAASKEEPSGIAASPSSRARPTKGDDDDDSGSDAFPFGISGTAGRDLANEVIPQGEQAAFNEDFGNAESADNLDAAVAAPEAPLAPAGVDADEDDDDDDDDDSDSFSPFGFAGRRGAGSYNVFFPIHFSSSRARSFDGFSSYHAVANSLATGRKGIATSHATSLPSATAFQRSKPEEKPAEA
nr:unnamed protein product [Callosobruchus analis]